jgi:transcriptional regulator with XRE-family HTH domain
LSQQDVAEKAGVSRNFASAVERGRQGLDAWRLHLAATAVGVTLDWLLSGPDDQITAPNRNADTPGPVR